MRGFPRGSKRKRSRSTRSISQSRYDKSESGGGTECGSRGGLARVSAFRTTRVGDGYGTTNTSVTAQRFNRRLLNRYRTAPDDPETTETVDFGSNALAIWAIPDSIQPRTLATCEPLVVRAEAWKSKLSVLR